MLNISKKMGERRKEVKEGGKVIDIKYGERFWEFLTKKKMETPFRKVTRISYIGTLKYWSRSKTYLERGI